MSGQEEGRPHDGPGPETAENAFALAFPKGDESFPVLKAFQEFLDAERERARRRQMTLTICFMSAIVLLVVLFCVVGAILFSGMMRRSDAQQAQMLDILMQRMPAPVAQAPAVQPPPAQIPAPVAESRPDPQVSELLDVIKALQSQNAEMMSALQQRIREPAPAAEAAAKARKTGIYSSPRRKPEPEPGPEQPETLVEAPAEAAAPAETPAEAAAPAEAPVPDATAEVPEEPAAPVAEQPAAPVAVEPESAVEPAAAAAAPAEAPPTESGPIQMKIIRSRVMLAPPGYAPEQITIVSSGNVKFPWRVLMPTGTNTAEAAR